MDKKNKQKMDKKMESVDDATLEVAMDILGIIQYLENKDDAVEYVRLYLLAQKEAERHGEDVIDVDGVYHILSEMKHRVPHKLYE